MKKQLRLVLFAALVLVLILTLGIMASAATDGSATQEEGHQYKVSVSGSDDAYYTTMVAAWGAIPEGGTATITLLGDVSDFFPVMTGQKTVTITGGETMKTITFTAFPSDNVNYKGRIISIYDCAVTFDNVKFVTDGFEKKAVNQIKNYLALAYVQSGTNVMTQMTLNNVVSEIGNVYGIWVNGTSAQTKQFELVIKGEKTSILGGKTNVIRIQNNNTTFGTLKIEGGLLDGSNTADPILIGNHQTLTITGGTIKGGTNEAILFKTLNDAATLEMVNNVTISGAKLIGKANAPIFNFVAVEGCCGFNVTVTDCEFTVTDANGTLMVSPAEGSKNFAFAKIASGKVIIDGGKLPDASYDQWFDWTETAVLLTNFAVDSITTAGTWHITSMQDIADLIDIAIQGGVGDEGNKFSKLEIDTSAIPKTLVINHPDAIVNIAVGEYLAIETLVQVKAGTLNITGGTFTSPSTDDANGVALFLIENGTINIGGGDFIAACVLRTMDVATGNAALVNITGGNFTTNAKVSTDAHMFANTSHGAIINISGGVFKAGIKNQSIVAIESARGDKAAVAPTINISGGSFELGLSWIYLNAAGVINIMPHASGDASKDPVFSEVSYAGEGAQDREPYAVYMTSKCNEGVINISGGTMSIRNAAVALIYASVGTLNISGGDISGVYRVVDLSSSTPANVNISGGTLTAVRERVFYWSTSASSTTTAAVTITGGNFVAAANNGEIGYLSSAAPNLSFVIKGGTFTSESVRLFYLGKGTKIAFSIEGGEFSTAASRMFYVEQNETPMVIKGGTFTLLDNGKGKAENAIVYMAGREYAIVNVMGGTFFDERAGSNQVFYKQNARGVINFGGSFTVYSKNAKSFTYFDTDYEGANSFKLPSTKVTPAGKEGEYYICKAYESADGPSMVGVPVLRANEGAMGLRFTSVVPATTVAKLSGKGTVSYGTLIFPAEYVSALNGTTDVLGALKAYAQDNNLPESKVFVNIAADKGVSSDAAGNIIIRASLVNIKEANYGKDFMAISYAKTTNKRGQSTYYYASFNTGLYGNISEAAEYAYNDICEMAEQKEDGRIYAYKFIEDEFLYSRFSAKQQNEMKKYFKK